MNNSMQMINEKYLDRIHRQQHLAINNADQEPFTGAEDEEEKQTPKGAALSPSKAVKAQ